MIPDADIVALSTSVSNHWSRKSMALMVMSCTWLYLSSPFRSLKRRPRKRSFIRSLGLREVGWGHGEDGLHEAAHLQHGLSEFFVGLSVELGVAGDFAARLSVIVDAPE